MKKILIVLALLPMVLFAGLHMEKVTDVLSNLVGEKPLKFYTTDNNYITSNNKLNFTSLSSADIVLFSISDKYKNKLIIVNSYEKLKINKNSIGAIYLKKGRTQIVFIKERLSKNRLVLNPKFMKHILNEWQLNKTTLLNGLK